MVGTVEASVALAEGAASAGAASVLPFGASGPPHRSHDAVAQSETKETSATSLVRASKPAVSTKNREPSADRVRGSTVPQDGLASAADLEISGLCERLQCGIGCA